MTQWNALVDALTMVLLGAGGYVLLQLKNGTETVVKTVAEGAAKAALAERFWMAELSRELQKARGVERQELRYRSYGLLWKELRPLAIYDDTVIDKTTMGELSNKLSDWYFAEAGGLLLTPQARDFYFALQDLLGTVVSLPADWSVERPETPEGTHLSLLRGMLENEGEKGATDALDYLKADAFADWQERAPALAKEWRVGIKRIAAGWMEMDPRQRFALLQQTGSKLRTSLTIDLESRAR